MRTILFFLLPVWLALGATNDDTRMLCDFESPVPPAIWEYSAGKPQPDTSSPLEGLTSLRIAFDPAARYYGAYIRSSRLPGDWSAYDALVLDVFNPQPQPVAGYLLIADEAWRKAGATYWNRHNAERAFPPGRTRWSIPIGGLYRGEAGSRNNDIKRNIDPSRIVRVDFGFGLRGADGNIVIDALRLMRTRPPASVRALDFGPPDQSLMPGWSPASNETRYSPERGYGWGPQGGTPWEGAARDTAFAGPLLQDFCEAGGYRFRVKVPAGAYKVTVFFENSGYWGGEQTMFRRRRILAGGKTAWTEDRADGPAHALFRFEDTEPIGVDAWDTYMAPELARPAVFEATAGNNGIDLEFEADRVWGSKVSAIVLYPVDDAEAAKWVAGELQTVADDFRRQAVCLDPPAPAFTPSPTWQAAGMVAWPVRIEDEITPRSVPPASAPAPAAIQMRRVAMRGEYEPFCIAVRPLRDMGTCRFLLEPLRNKSGGVAASVAVVRYGMRRSAGELAYHTIAHTLRTSPVISMPASVTREVVVTAGVSLQSAPGLYKGTLALIDETGRHALRIPLELEVRPVTLSRDTEFLMGFYGLMPPALLPEEHQRKALQQTLIGLKDHGMNAVCGGPDWELTGWKDGEPTINFGAVDDFVSILTRCGFTRPINGYGGMRFRGLHDGYEKGEVARQVESQSGLAYDDAFMRAWGAVDAHARAAGWPTILYAMCDETRVRDRAERELEFMRLMSRASACYPETVRTMGSYSVSFESRPTDPENLTYWHQLFFDGLDVSALNVHDQTVLDEARRLGREVHIYNQGRTRYSFGLYQWAEFRRGVRARWQWHLNILHGYQYFDLDGREPDTAMICYGRDAIYPTVDFERCREGAEDFYLYQQLARAAEAHGADAPGAAADARKFLEESVAGVAVNERTPPRAYDADALKLRAVELLERLAPTDEPRR